MRDGGFLLHPILSTRSSWSFVLTRFCTLTWQRKFWCGPYQMSTWAKVSPRASGSPPL